MKKILMIAVLLAATAFSGLVEAGELSNASLDKLLILSGTNKQVSQFPRLLRMGMDQARQREKSIHENPAMSDGEYEVLVNTMTDAFKPMNILQAIGGEVKHSVSEQDAKKILAWYDSRLGKKVKNAEEVATTPASYREMVASAKTLLADKKRVQFAKKLDALLHITDTTMHIQVNAALAMFVAFSSEINPHQPVDTKAFRKRLSAHLRKGRPKIERLVILSTVYTYRKIDMNSLEKYLAFLNSPEARRFNKSLIAGMETGMNQSMERMARAVMSLFKKNNLQQI